MLRELSLKAKRRNSTAAPNSSAAPGNTPVRPALHADKLASYAPASESLSSRLAAARSRSAPPDSDDDDPETPKTRRGLAHAASHDTDASPTKARTASSQPAGARLSRSVSALVRKDSASPREKAHSTQKSHTSHDSPQSKPFRGFPSRSNSFFRSRGSPDHGANPPSPGRRLSIGPRSRSSVERRRTLSDANQNEGPSETTDRKDSSETVSASEVDEDEDPIASSTRAAALQSKNLPLALVRASHNKSKPVVNNDQETLDDIDGAKPVVEITGAARKATHSLRDRMPEPEETRKDSSAPEQTEVTGSAVSEDASTPRRAPGLTSPLLSVSELLAWRPTGAAARCVSRVPLPAATVARYSRNSVVSSTSSRETSISDSPAAPSSVSSVKRIQPPRLLLCHDFARGYPEWEANVDGVFGDDCPEDAAMWRFNHWCYVDIFVYFSHHRITIPPVGYIHAGHRHGALVLGTLIFEWEAGADDLRHILSSFRTRAKAAAQLAAIAKFFGFDGWLVNVECALSDSAAASDLVAFVSELTRATRKLVGAASEVIWYDSVIRSGELKYQNEMNAENEPFFKAAGAIFTNYHWDRNAPVRSAVKAGPRRTDVFTGIDVHGRNTFGGGGFQTHIALRSIKQSGTSAAIFAPAWTVESCPPGLPDPLSIEERFWTGPRGKFGRECVAQYIKERPVITELPFSTCFDPGWGPRTSKDGVVVDHRRYFNMSRQEIQPSFLRTYVASGDITAASLALSHEFALNGSASVLVRYAFASSRMMSGTYSILRLFVANLSLTGLGTSAFTGGAHSRLSRSSTLAKGMPSSFMERAESMDSGTPTGTPTASLSARGKNSLRVSYTFLVQKGEAGAEAARTFGLVVMCNSPSHAILLVSPDSDWAAEHQGEHPDADDGEFGALPVSSVMSPSSRTSTSGTRGRSMRVALRLQILGKYVTCTVVTPTKEYGIETANDDDEGVWATREFDLPQSLVAGQRVSDIMVLVGKPSPFPQSGAPSPFMSAAPSRTASRFASRAGSRMGSRDVSRYGSRAGSREGSRRASRAGSPRGSRSGSPPRAEDVLSNAADMAGVERGSHRLGTPSQRRQASLTSSRLSRSRGDSQLGSSVVSRRLSGFEGEKDDGSDPRSGIITRQHLADRRIAADGFERSSGSAYMERPPRAGGDYQGQESEGRRSRPVSSYADAFAVPGQVDFSQLEAGADGDWSANASMAISRLSSRLGTPGGSRSGSRLGSRLASRNGSAAGSLAPSRSGSARPSRFASPARTPLTGGGGALPMYKDMLGVDPAMLSDGVSPIRHSAAPLSDLKTALMQAANNMAGASSASGAVGEGSMSMTHTVFLGAVRLEVYEVRGIAAKARSTLGFDEAIQASTPGARSRSSMLLSAPASPLTLHRR